MHFVDDRLKLALKSQIGKQIIEQLKVRPSVAITLSEPLFESALLPEIPAVAIPAPVVYEEQHIPTAYIGSPEYQQHEQPMLTDLLLTPQFRLEPVQPIEASVPELSAAAEISQAVELATYPDSVDGILQADFPGPGPGQGLESLLDDPLLGPLGPLF